MGYEMIKAQTVSHKSFPNNSELINKYLENLSHSKISQRTAKTSLKTFNDFYGRSLQHLQIKDVKSFHKFLNKSPKYTLRTKKQYFGFLKRFIEDFLQMNIQYFKAEDVILFMFFLKDAHNFKWDREHFHKESERDNNVTLEKIEITTILNHLKLKYYTKYLMFRLLAETGMRKGELLSVDLYVKNKGVQIDIEKDLNKRFLRVRGKTGKKAYYISQNLSKLLLSYAESRRKMRVNSNAFFLSDQGNRFSLGVLYKLLVGYDQKQKDGSIKRIKGLCEKLGIDKHITPKTFRLTLNDFREQMDCPDKYLKILLNHKEANINYEHYVSDKTKRDKFIEFYDKFNPYKNLKL